MLDIEYIKVGRVAVAYGLEDVEINQLIDAVGAHFGPSTLGSLMGFPIEKPYSDETSYDVAKQFIATLPCSGIELTDPERWKNLAEHFGAKDTTIDYAELGKGLFETIEDNHSWWAAVLSMILRDASIINKRSCISYLHSCGYPLQQEVKGLTHDLIAMIIKDGVVTAPSPGHLSPSQGDTASQKAAWKNYHDSLPNGKKSVKNKRAAFAAILKWDGCSHLHVHEEVFSNYSDRTLNAKTKAVSALKETAEEISRDIGLPMPEWDTR